MSVIIYREGGTHVVKGVACEQLIVQPGQLHAHLANGCVLDPAELSKDPVGPTNKEIRAEAEKAGIEGFDTKRIAALKAELGYDD
jgi:hypothetical protein